MAALDSAFRPEAATPRATNERPGRRPAPWCSPTSPGFTRLSEQLAELGRAGAEELTLILNDTFECATRASPVPKAAISSSSAATRCSCSSTATATPNGRAERPTACAPHSRRAAPWSPGVGGCVLRISMGVHSGAVPVRARRTTPARVVRAGEHATTVTAMESAADAGEILHQPGDGCARCRRTWLGEARRTACCCARVGEHADRCSTPST